MKITTFLLASALGVSASVASAATLYDATLIPSSSTGSTTFFDNNNDFSETFAFGSSLASGDVVDSFRLTLDVSGARNEKGWVFSEDWDLRVQGSQSGSISVDDYITDISGDGLLSFNIAASADTDNIDAFSTSVATGNFEFWLAEQSGYLSGLGPNNPSITINSARLEVFGTVAPVPLPATAWLLLAGVGGIGAMRRSRRG